MLHISKTRWLIAAAGALVLALGLRSAGAAGALAVGHTGDLAKDGYSLGIAVDMDSEDEARKEALAWCRKNGSARTQPLCKVLETFRNQCAAEVLDAKAGMPGTGWAIGPDKAIAERRAMDMCLATAGKTRQEFCKIGTLLCDTKGGR
jgi:Domain of unknown function (DUF4189)